MTFSVALGNLQILIYLAHRLLYLVKCVCRHILTDPPEIIILLLTQRPEYLRNLISKPPKTVVINL